MGAEFLHRKGLEGLRLRLRLSRPLGPVGMEWACSPGSQGWECLPTQERTLLQKKCSPGHQSCHCCLSGYGQGASVPVSWQGGAKDVLWKPGGHCTGQCQPCLGTFVCGAHSNPPQDPMSPAPQPLVGRREGEASSHPVCDSASKAPPRGVGTKSRW